MGNAKSKKPNNPFERGKEEVQRRKEEIKKNADPKNKRAGRLVPQSVMLKGMAINHLPGVAPSAPSEPTETFELNIPTAPPDPYPPTAPMEPNATNDISPYDQVLLDHMKYQLDHDSNAFLLNNILLSVQFFENYEREVLQIKETPSKEEILINEAMIRYNKHVFFADRLLERVSDHVNFQRSRGQLEALASPKLYVLHDNVETKEVGDTSNYSSTLDAPFYKLQLEDCKEIGYMKLRKLEVLNKKAPVDVVKDITDDGVSADSENELDDTDETIFVPEDLSLKLKPKTDILHKNYKTSSVNSLSVLDMPSTSGQVNKDNELRSRIYISQDSLDQEIAKPKKSILKTTTGTKYIRAKDRQIHINQNNYVEESSESSGSSGIGSILSGGSAPSESAVPKRLELQTGYLSSSGVLSDDCWTVVIKKKQKSENQVDPTQINADYNLSDEEDDEIIDLAYDARILHERLYYLNSPKFMNTFIVNFKQDLGIGLGFSRTAIRNAMTHAASIYCDHFKDFLKINYEIIPGLTATWPNAANPWIFRERKIVQNPRNNYQYKWPEPPMVDKARDFGCLLIPRGYNPKGRSNPEKSLQWRITFPESERYLESLLAHSQIRCYLFTLLLHKTFLDNDMLIGIDSNPIKNHLFLQCEANFAAWPEDRLGESLMSFLETFYKQFSKSRQPNYFMDSCNEFESIPAHVLLLLQWKLKDIIETPVMHMLYAIDKLKYNSIGFYPTFDSQKLFEIITCKNPLHLSSPNVSAASNDRENPRRPKRKIRTSIRLPKKLGTARRHKVLNFFIQHFISMARSSEKFDDINQALIYLEQARRLCYLLLDQPGGDSTADEYLEIIRDKLTDCHRKKANKAGFKLSPRPEIKTQTENRYNYAPNNNNIRQLPKMERGVSQDSIIEDNSIQPITVADFHMELQNNSATEDHQIVSTTVADAENQEEERKTKHSDTYIVTTADVHVEVEQNKDSASKDRSEGKPVKGLEDINKQKRHIQLMGSVVEETYL